MNKPYGIHDDNGRLLVWVGAPDWKIKIPIPPNTAATTIQDGYIELTAAQLLAGHDKKAVRKEDLPDSWQDSSEWFLDKEAGLS